MDDIVAVAQKVKEATFLADLLQEFVARVWVAYRRNK